MFKLFSFPLGTVTKWFHAVKALLIDFSIVTVFLVFQLHFQAGWSTAVDSTDFPLNLSCDTAQVKPVLYCPKLYIPPIPRADGQECPLQAAHVSMFIHSHKPGCQYDLICWLFLCLFTLELLIFLASFCVADSCYLWLQHRTQINLLRVIQYCLNTSWIQIFFSRVS